jgi:phosphohistidine swiveling domain-containing protein
MAATASTDGNYTAPGPGAWELETVHFTRPISRLMQAPMLGGFVRGFKEGTARYGLMLSHIEPAIVNSFIYMRPVPFGAPPSATKPPPKIVFQLLTRLVPKIRRRIADSVRALEGRQWRKDLEWWDNEIKPKAIAKHKKLQAVDPAALDDAALLAHLSTCLEHASNMVYQHHQFTSTCIMPVGDLLAHVQDWTGKSTGEILQVLRGSTKISNGAAADELVALAAALDADDAASAILTGKKPAKDIIAALEGDAGKVGETMRAYLEIVRNRTLGYDIASKSGGELPELLVGTIRAAIDGAAGRKDDAKERIAKLRDAVPKQHHAQFDELLAEARAINRLRDERGHYSDSWATGIARRVALEVGRRLLAKGKLNDAEQAVDCAEEEIVALMGGASSPSAGEIEKRAIHRTTKTVNDEDVPKWLGAPPSGPPPVEWLPKHGRRAQRAISTFLGAMFTEPDGKTTKNAVKGLPVSPGVYEGTARLIDQEADFGRIQKGDVLVTRATSPYFNVVLPLLGAIVTDRGGQLCHAAIVSREYGIPGVVGTKDATKLVKDGARVRVDGDAGTVEVL